MLCSQSCAYSSTSYIDRHRPMHTKCNKHRHSHAPTNTATRTHTHNPLVPIPDAIWKSHGGYFHHVVFRLLLALATDAAEQAVNKRTRTFEQRKLALKAPPTHPPTHPIYHRALIYAASTGVILKCTQDKPNQANHSKILNRCQSSAFTGRKENCVAAASPH